MHRAQQPGKKPFAKKWDQRNHRLHRNRLKTVQPSIDNNPPRSFPHLETKRKRDQLLLERYSQIEKDNRLLLQRMADIMGRDTYDMKSENHSKSLNAEARRRQLERITHENQQILKRIQSRRSTYDHREWEAQWREHEKVMEHMCEYPYILKKKDLMASATAVDRLHESKSAANLIALAHEGSVNPKLKQQHQRSKTSASIKPRRMAKLQPIAAAKQKSKSGGSQKGGKRIILREGKNLDGTYVIISVSEKALAKRSKSGSSKYWWYKLYDPHISDEVTIRVPLETIRRAAANERPDLLTPRLKNELAAYSLNFLAANSSTGVLRAEFVSQVSRSTIHQQEMLPEPGSLKYGEDAFTDEFGRKEDMPLPIPPKMSMDTTSVPLDLDEQSEFNLKLPNWTKILSSSTIVLSKTVGNVAKILGFDETVLTCSSSEDAKIHRIDMRSGEIICSFESGSKTSGTLACSNDEGLILTLASKRKAVQIWGANAQLSTFKTSSKIVTASVLRNNDIVLGLEDNNVVLYRNNQPLQSLKVGNNRLVCVSGGITVDSQPIIVAGVADGKIYSSSGSMDRELDGTHMGISHLIVSAHASQAFSAASDGTIVRWMLGEEYRKISTLCRPANNIKISCCILTCAGRVLVTAHAASIDLIDAQTGELLGSASVSAHVRDLALAKDGARIAALLVDNTILMIPLFNQ